MQTLPRPTTATRPVPRGFQPATLYLRDAAGVSPFRKPGYARLLPNGWVDFLPDDAAPNSPTSHTSFPAHRVLKIEWAR
jgi:hypothetical protein